MLENVGKWKELQDEDSVFAEFFVANSGQYLTNSGRLYSYTPI